MTDSMNTRINTVLAGICLLAALYSCQKNIPAEGNAQARAIRFSVPSVQTKATDAAPESNVFQVRDYYNGGLNVNNTLAYNAGTGAWKYGSSYTPGSEPLWLNGTHTLFGWLSSDGEEASSWFGSAPSLSGTTLTIPTKAMKNNIWQMDFLYSDVVVRKTSEPNFDEEVPLIFNHLFCRVALSFRVKQVSAGETFNLKRVYLSNGFKNSNGATIDFSVAGTPVVTYGTAATDGSSSGFISSPVSFDIDDYNASSTPIDILSQNQSPIASPFLMWPLGAGDLTGDSNKNIVVEYTITPDGGVESALQTSQMAFPKGTTWKAGCSYSYAVEYMSGIIRVEETVLPWNQTISENEGEVVAAVASWMGWNTQSYDFGNTAGISPYNNEFDVIFKKSAGVFQQIHGFFRIDSPKECTFTVALQEADKDCYTITPNDGSDTHTGFGHIVTALDPAGGIDNEHGYYLPGQKIDLYLNVDTSNYTSGQKSVKTSFSVTVNDGGTDRTINVDSEMQRYGKFNIIIPSI